MNKHHYIFSALLTFSVVFRLNAQKLPDLIPFKEKDLYGYCDSNLKVVIKAQFQFAYPFIEDRAIVVKDNLNGFIDTKGNQIAPCIYKYVSPFSDGVALVGKSREEARYIDKNGQFSSRENEYAKVPLPGGDSRNSPNNAAGPIKDGVYFYRTRDHKEGYMTTDGDTISGSEFSYPYYAESYSTPDNYDRHFQHFYEGRAVVAGKNGKGHIDLQGRLVVDTMYEAAFNFKEGRAKVKLNGKYGFVDKQGNVIGEIKYDQASYFYGGLAQVIIGEKCGYVNLEGEEVVPIKYDYWQGEQYSPFKNGFVRVRIDDKFGIVDQNGNEVTAVKYDDILPFYGNCALVKLNDKFGLVDQTGKEEIPPIYGYLSWLDAYALIFEEEQGNRCYGLININGKILFSNLVHRPQLNEGDGAMGLYRIVVREKGTFYVDLYGTEYREE